MLDNAKPMLAALAQRTGHAHMHFTLTICLPLVLYALWKKRKTWLGCLSIAGTGTVLGSVALSPGGRDLLLAAVAMHAYYAAIAVAVFLVSSKFDLRAHGKDTLFAALFIGAVALPALVRSGCGLAFSLVGGWFLCLSLFSYCQDTGPGRPRPSLFDLLFFTHVDPSLVFVERASISPKRRPPWKDVTRAMGGLALATVGQAILFEFAAIAQLVRSTAMPDSPYASMLALGTLCFLSVYWIRAGFVGFQVGLLGLCGREVQESYDHPYLAISPRDFWNRWNLYVGRWARRYLFSPVALGLSRRLRRASRRLRSVLPRAAAAFATFAAIGLLHDALNFAGESTTGFVFLKTFAFSAAGLLLWEAAPKRRGPIMATRASTAVALASISIRHVLMVHYFAAFPILLGAL